MRNAGQLWIENISLVDVAGKVVFEKSLQSKELAYDFDFSGIEAGLYFLRMKTEVGMKVEKVLLR